MVDMFEIKMCNYCKNTQCSKKINITTERKMTIYKCDEYIQDKKKKKQYKQLEFVTAKRDHIKLRQI